MGARGRITSKVEGFPMQAAFGFLVGVQPVDDRQSREVEAVRDGLVRLRHPGARPDQFAGQGQQMPAIVRVKSLQQRIAGDLGIARRVAAAPMGRVDRPGPQPQEPRQVDAPYGCSDYAAALPRAMRNRHPAAVLTKQIRV
jgi:hypothetical protein